MLSIENIIPIYDNTYILLFSQSSKEINVISPETKIILKSPKQQRYKVIHTPDTYNRTQHKENTCGTCSLVIPDKTNELNFYSTISKLEFELNNIVLDKFPEVKISHSNVSLSNILVSQEFIQIIEQCISEEVTAYCNITPQGCITPQDTFEIIYKLTSIEKIPRMSPVVGEIYSLLENGITNTKISDIENYIYSNKEIHIYEIPNDEIDILQNEIDQQFKIIK